jgi:hypothetical protein
MSTLLTLSFRISPSFSQSQLSPNAKNQTPPQKKKKISLFLAQQVIFLEVLWSQHPCSDLPTDFISFCK